MDTDTGKLINYRQLMRSAENKKAWTLSSANEFGQLVNGIGGRIKNPTNTIEFIFKHKLPTEQKHGVTYRQFVCTVRPKKSGTQSNALHRWRRQDQLPWRSRHPHCGNASGQNALQQCHLHKWGTLHDNGHLQLLPNDTIAPA